MISISKSKTLRNHLSKFRLVCGICVLIVAWAGDVQAQATQVQTLTVSPTLFEMQAERGQAWTSEVRVVNANDYPITVYPQVVNFAPLGEDGRGDLIPVLEAETGGQTLAEWITVPADPVTIPAQKTVAVPLQVNIPDTAAPGGHYAAVMIGTRPPQEAGTSQVQTAQIVTSLFFVSVAGAIEERGIIREFTTNARVVETPVIELALRFENGGNVHLQPQGEIKIYNQWGKERGIIPINHQTHFGNVLPESIRKFTFTWSGETSLYDMGRYQAVLTLGYGQSQKQFVTSTTYFWVVPYMLLLYVGIGLFIAVRLLLWAARRYIEKTLAHSGIRLQEGVRVPDHIRDGIDSGTVVVRPVQSVRLAPPTVSVWSDWSTKAVAVAAYVGRHGREVAAWGYRTYVRYPRQTLIALVVGVLCVVTILITSAMTKERTHYEVSIGNDGTALTLSAEEVAYRALAQASTLPKSTTKTVPIEVVNVSGQAGAAAKARIELEKAGYLVSDMTTDTSRADARTVIVFDAADQETAVAVSQLLPRALLSARDAQDENGTIVVFAGGDVVQ